MGTATISGLMYRPQMTEEGDCEAIGGMRLARETEVLGENLPQRHFVPPQIPHDQTRVRTRAAQVGSQRLTAWAMARPPGIFLEGKRLPVRKADNLIAICEPIV
jgi:hypothetical protein